MSTALQRQQTEELNQAIMQVVMAGDLAGLTEVERFQYYTYMCKKGGLDPALSPFEYIKLNGKTVLYAKKGAAEQLRSIHNVSLERISQEVKLDTILIETKATTPDGRIDVGLGAVSCKGLSGSDLANAFMKCETKSKRRATLSICGLNMLDETEVADMRTGGVYPDQPMPGDGMPTDAAHTNEYCCSQNLAKAFPALARRPISKCDPAILRTAVEAVESKAKKSAKPIPPWAAEFIMNAEPIIASWENQQPQNPDALELEPGSEG